MRPSIGQRGGGGTRVGKHAFRTPDGIACRTLAAAWLCGAVTAWFVLARLYAFLPAEVTTFPDSGTFLAKAATPTLSFDFFFGDGRLFTVPLLWAPWAGSAGSATVAVSYVQFLVATVAWLLLAAAVSLHCESAAGRLVAWSLVLALGNSDTFAMWDRVLLSESISSSLFATLMAAWLWWGQRRLAGKATRLHSVALIVVGTAWGFSREANSLFLIMLASAALVVTIPRRAGDPPNRRIDGVLVAASFCLVFVLVHTVAERGERWFFPLLNVVGRRVLPSAERTAFYTERGMPLSPALLEMTGEFASGRGWAFYESPALEEFRTWVRAHGRRTYVRDLLRDPVRTIAEPLVDAREFVCPDLARYRPVGFSSALPGWLGAASCGRGSSQLALMLALLAAVSIPLACAISYHAASRRIAFQALTVALLFVAWPVLTWLTWHAIGEMEVGRHVLWATQMLYLGGAASSAWLFDAGIRTLPRFRRRSKPAPQTHDAGASSSRPRATAETV